jgi:hypothetical protein
MAWSMQRDRDSHLLSFEEAIHAQGQSPERKWRLRCPRIIEHFTESGSLKGRPDIIWPDTISFKMSMRTRKIPLKRMTALVRTQRTVICEDKF